MNERVAVIGWACSEFLPEHMLLLDELVFENVATALRDAGVRKQEAGISVVASSDLYDGRGFSNGMTTPAAGGYLNDEYRLENDASTALVAAIGAIQGRMTDIAIVCAYHNPEISGDELSRSGFQRQVSNLSLDPFFLRPIGLDSISFHALHANFGGTEGAPSMVERQRALAKIAADEINRGCSSPRSVRKHKVEESDILSARALSTPLTELMMPAATCGAVTLILASEARSRRTTQVRGWITGYGVSATRYAWDPGWLLNPTEAAARAARKAYEQAGVRVPEDEIGCAELTAPTPAVVPDLVRAFGLGPSTVVNPSGGVRSAYPGLANGNLRILEALDWLGRQRPGAGRGKAVAHSMDDITGFVASNSAAFVLEGA